MKPSHILTSVLALTLALGAVAAQAHDRDGDRKGRDGERGALMFQELDANGDGQLTLAEIESSGAARFAAADTDGDGLLSADELRAQADARADERAGARRAERSARMIERQDANDDGLLSPEEMMGRRDPARMFERVDANSDGVVTAEEFAEAGKKMHRGKGDHGRGHN